MKADTFETLTLCQAVATAYEALGEGYQMAQHGYRSRWTEAVRRAYSI